MILWRPTRPSRINTKKRCPFHHRELEGKSRKTRDTWNNRQVWPWNTKWNRVFIWSTKWQEFCKKATLVIANTLNQQHKRRLYTWTSCVDGQCWNQIDYILCSWGWKSSILSAKPRSGADCLSDNEHLIAKFRLKLKEVEKTTDHSGMT